MKKKWLVVFAPYLPYFICTILIVIDQVIKWWVLSRNLFVKYNAGFIFGWGSNWDLFFWVSCILIVILFIYSIKKPPLQTVNLFIILAAALSNLIDRVFRDGVVDYWQINYFRVQIFFNFADLLLILGVFVYAWQIGKENHN